MRAGQETLAPGPGSAPLRVEAPTSEDPPAPAAALRLVPGIEAFLGGVIDRAPLPENLREAVRYSAMSPGKRLRPVLAGLSCEAVGAAAERSFAGAAALELVHAFSLVHDDLPAMDDDDLRRGLPTAHVKFGEAMAILSGDAMLSLAFQTVTEWSGDAGLAGALCAELASGTTAMIGGQVYDTLGGLPAGLSEAERVALVHRNKTGALLRASCRMGALSGLWPASGDPRLGSLTAYGEAVGLMFQIIDDLLDVEQTTERLGKRAAKDEGAGKLTYPGALGVEGSRREVARLRVVAAESVAPLGRAATPLVELCEYLAVRTR